MRAPIVVSLILTLGATNLGLAGQREHGRTDSSRHPEVREERAMSSFSGGGDRDLTLMERVDPAVKHYWSDRCVDQRRFGGRHSRDCDNPAYTGGTGHRGPYYGPYGDYGGYGGHGGYGGFRPRTYDSRSGIQIIERERREFVPRSSTPAYRPSGGLRPMHR